MPYRHRRGTGCAGAPAHTSKRGGGPMHDILAKPAAIATCGLFNMKRRAKEALPAQGSIEWVVIVVCIAVALIAALVYLSNQMNIKINTVSKTLAGTNVNGANTPS